MIKKNNEKNKELFYKLKDDLMNIDPVKYCETYLKLDGEPFTLSNNGYKPFSDIYRYIGIKALEPGAKPTIIVKGRQVGATTMASALEMYFMGSGLFGTGIKPAIRVIHAFPQLELAAAYSKTKLNQMIISSIPAAGQEEKRGVKPKSYMQSLLDLSSPTNDSMHFKQFVGGNHLWIESIGLDGDRIMGRQLCLETEIPTPIGFIKLKDLKEGDQLFDEHGNICNVIKLHPINLSPESYRLTFDDGAIVDACSEHLWLTYTKSNRSRKTLPKIKNTKEIFETLKVGTDSNHSIPCTKPLNYFKQNLLLDPYLLGIWLGDGDGSGRIETADIEILEKYDYNLITSSINRKSGFGVSKSRSYRVKGLTNKLYQLGLLKNTHKQFNEIYNKEIPKKYLYSSFEQRLSLLQGLMDTDGHCDKNGHCEFVQVRENLANQVYELILSLGIKATIAKRESWRYDVRYQDKYRIRFRTSLPVFRLKRKLINLKKDSVRTTHRFIKKIEKIKSKPMRCITVDSPSHLFLITKNFIPTHNTADVMFFDEVQKTTSLAIGNSLKVLTTAKYGRQPGGVQVYFGTPRRKGSDFYKMWQKSSQQYYYLGCEKCEKHFPLYTPGSDEWKKIWIHTKIVKCTHCGHEQNKLQAAERGKWVALKSIDDPDCDMVGFHINQLYMPMFTREDIDNESPGKHPINTERVFQNEVLGEFFQGDSSPITHEEIQDLCGDVGRKYSARLTPDKNQIVIMGIDYGARADLEQLANPDTSKAQGQSYSTAVILLSKGPGLLSIEYALKFKRNDIESKKGLIDQLTRQYGVQLTIGDIGYSNDFSTLMHTAYGDRYLVSRAHAKVNGHIKFTADAYPKEIVFERDYYIGELYEQMKKGMIRFPFGDFEKCGWLIDHCASMEIKPSISRSGDPTIHYVKGGSPNDGFMALLNAYIAYKFIVSAGFTNNNPLLQDLLQNRNKPLVLAGYVPRRL